LLIFSSIFSSIFIFIENFLMFYQDAGGRKVAKKPDLSGAFFPLKSMPKSNHAQ